MSDPVRYDLLPEHQDDSGVHLALYRYPATDDGGDTPRKPVLLLHGASGNHRTFTNPRGGLARWLARDFDPWLLDWRGSSLVVDDEDNKTSLDEHADAYNFNRAAQYDIPRAVSTIRHHTSNSTVAVLGFCMGSAILAEAVALGYVHRDEVDCIVLMTLGLFYEPPIDGRLKCEDRVLERVLGGPGTVCIDPRVGDPTARKLRVPWPEELDEFYAQWPKALKWHLDPPPGKALHPIDHMCNRVGFVYGIPYHHANLHPDIHGGGTGPALLPELFGGIPFHMLIHGARNIRQRHATFYPMKNAQGPTRSDADFVSDAARERFRTFDQVTFITGALNRLWHRDSIDLMYEWLRGGTAEDPAHISKHVVSGYGHQDLLWGEYASEHVFPLIQAGLGQDPLTISSPSRQRFASQGMPSRIAATSPLR